MTTLARRLALLPLIAALALVGCTATATAPASATPAGATPAASHAAHESAAAGGGMEVALVEFAFAPTELTVPAGTTVTFTNDDSALHSVSEGSNGQVAEDAAFDEDVDGGASVDIAFDEPGTVQITCKYHPSMNMTVTVEG